MTTLYLLIIPTSALPAGVGTIAVDESRGVFVELLGDDEGVWVPWSEIADLVLYQRGEEAINATPD